MKALLVASDETCALPLFRLLRGHMTDVEVVTPAELTATFASSNPLFVLFPSENGSDVPALVDACWRLRGSPDRFPLMLAVAHDLQQVSALVDAGADDFLLWPAEQQLFNRRLDICRTRLARREREAIRTGHLGEAVRDAEQSTQRFRNLADSSTEILTLVSPGGVRLYVSPACRTILGYEPDELLGSSMLDILHPDDTSKLVEARECLHQGAEVAETTIRLQRKEGDFVWLETSCRPMRDPKTGAIEEIIMVARDTATPAEAPREQRARQERLDYEERFRSIVERITELVCRYLPDGTLIYVNEAYCRTFNATPENLVGKSFIPMLPPEDQEIIHRSIAALTPEQPVASSIHRVVLPNGDIRWQEWYDRGTFDEAGHLVELVGTGRDITERLMLEQELADAGNFLRDVIDAVPDPISVEGDDDKLMMVNRSFAELVGQPRDQIVGRTVASIRPAARGRVAGPWPEVSDEHEITWRAPDGLVRSLFEKRAVLADRRGHHVLVSVMRDVTERKRYEAQLVLTERLASLGTLAAGIAHEINNPLSYVIGNVAFAVDNLSPGRMSGSEFPQLPEIRSALTEALEGARRIASIVRDVKVFSRADRETLKLVEPESIVEAALRMVQSSIESRARIVRESSEVPRVLANEARLAQVIVNLLMNAVQAFPDRPAADNRIVLAVRAEQQSVVMEVRDNGEGIAPDKLRHVFDPFFTTKDVGEGMGLGLSICNSIINAHGGRIDVDSSVGVGTAFRVIIPAAPLPVKREAKP